jgi:hypothetical protein
MNRLIVFLFGAICGGGAASCVYTCHIVQTKDAWLIVPRAGVNVNDIYVDVRQWSLADWRKHPDLARDMLKAGHAEVIKEQAVDDVVDEAVDRLTQTPHELRTRSRAAEPVDENDFDPQFAPQ